MTRAEAEAEMMQGFFDGHDRECPEPSENRSHSYRHGFANGRDDINHSPRDTAQRLREAAENAIAADVAVEQ